MMLTSLQFSNAENFIFSAEILSKYYKDRDMKICDSISRSIPFYHLIAHATELLLKEYLIFRGCDQQDLLRYECRHNLCVLLEMCKEKGISFTPTFEKYVFQMSDSHKNHTYRYQEPANQDGSVFLSAPDSDSLLFEIHRELEKLGRKIKLADGYEFLKKRRKEND